MRELLTSELCRYDEWIRKAHCRRMGIQYTFRVVDTVGLLSKCGHCVFGERSVCVPVSLPGKALVPD